MARSSACSCNSNKTFKLPVRASRELSLCLAPSKSPKVSSSWSNLKALLALHPSYKVNTMPIKMARSLDQILP